MIREKIFRLHRHKSSSSSAATDASGHKFDFTFSNIHAIQVPKGWDKVSVSLISPESGKVVHKSGKTPVKNGTCQWTETFSESIWISDVDGSKQLEEYLLKFLVAMGSSKSGILGEATLNLAAFLSSESPMLVSLPLKKCNYGTILQVEVKCLTPKTNLRDKKWKEMHANKEENADHDNIENQSDISDCTTAKNADHDNIENQSDISDCTTAKSIESFSSNNIGNSSRPRELSSRETSFSASVSRYSFDSMDDSVDRQSLSSQNERNGGNNVILRQDSIESNDSSSYCSYSTYGSVKSVRSHQSKTQREEFRKLSNATASFLQQNGGSSKTFKEADDATVQELEAEARMWEQNARKLAVDMERLRKELSDQSLNMTNLNIELARSHSECHKLTQEIEQLKLLLEESSLKQNVGENTEIQETAWSNIQKELEEEITFLKEENEHLSLQLKKTQESNIELISVLQEMEATINKQKLEIESLSMADIHDEIRLENNCILELELLNSQELQRSLQGEIFVLESILQDKIIGTEIEQDLKNWVLKEFIDECNHRLTAKEEKIMNLESALSRALFDEDLKETEHIDHIDVSKEIQQLKEKIQELKTDCNKLTEENLHLLFELEELKKSEYKSVIIEPNDDSLIKEREIEHLSYHKIHVSDEKIDELRSMERENNQTELVKHLSDLQEENVYLSQRVAGLEAQLRYLTDKSESSRLELQHLESEVVILESQIRRLEEEIELQKVDMQQKLMDMQKQWEEAQEECKALSKLNIRLQATTESLIEEHISLQKFNGEIREQKVKLQDHCLVLESEARRRRDEVQENLESSDKENKVVLAANKEKLLIMSQNVTNGESKHKSIIDELESKIRFSELERFRLSEENSLLHTQLQKVPELQNAVLALRVTLREMKSQNQFLEASFRSVSEDNEELKWEKNSMVEKVSSMQKALSKGEECRRKKNALEEKILRLEGDLIARDALCVRNVEMKNELNQIKIANSQLLMEVKHLEDVREDLQRRIQLLENELAKALKANDVYKSQLESAREKSEPTETINTEKTEHKISVLEAELQEIRERYLQISLKYAEVEDQREQLVMKLKALNI